MKRSLFIAIVVLLMAALFVSCNAEKSMEDQLFEVTIEAGARGLSATGTVNTNVDDLYWYYTATKTSGLFRTGEKTTLTAITGPGTNGEGLTGASLGSMSKGGWNFCFYGYAAGTTPDTTNPEANAVFFQKDLAAAISTTAIALQVTLERGSAVLDATVTFDGITWKIPVANVGYVGTLTLEISCPTLDTVEYGATPWNTTTGIASFSGAYSLAGYAGQTDPVLTFSVYNTYEAAGITLREKVGEDQIALKLVNGIQYTIVNTGDGIALYEDDDPQAATIGPITVPQSEIKGFTAESTGAAVVNAAGAKVTFPASALTTTEDHTLSVSTTPRATAEENFQIAGSTAVAAIDVKLDNAATSEFTGLVEIETTIETGLANVSVQYKNGTAYSSTFMYNNVETPYLKSYDSTNGKLVIQTNHFSEYVAVIDCVAKIGDKVYGSLVAAIADAQNGATIVLQKDANGAGIFLGANDHKNITVDLGGFTYTCSGPAVGSTGTATQAWHLEKDNTVTIKNGTLTSTANSGVYMLVQNYCNLTLDSVTLDGANIGNGQYTLSNNCGEINIIGNTSIYAPTNGRAFDVCAYASYSAGVTVNVSTTGTISGKVEIDANQPYPLALNISSGTFVGSFVPTSNTTDEEMRSIINITGGTFNGIEPVAYVNNVVYGSLMDAIDSVEKNATATIVLLKDVADGSGLSTDSRNADIYPKNLTIDFNGKTYTMKDPSVGSTGTMTQAMHWAAGSTIVLKNGTFAVQADAVNVKMGMQNYANLTIENMQIDLRSVQKTFYEEDVYQAYPDYYMKEVPIFNVSNLNASLLLKDSTVLVADAISWAVLADGPLTIDNCNLKKVAIGDGTVTVSNGEYVIVSYFDNKEVAQNGNVYSLVDVTN